MARLYKTFPQRPLTMAITKGDLACSTGLESRDVAGMSVIVGLNGETLQTAQRAAAHLSTDIASGRYEKTGLERPRALRIGIDVNAVVVWSSERAEGRH